MDTSRKVENECLYLCWEGGWVGRWVWMGVGCPCPPVHNNVVTPRHLLNTSIALIKLINRGNICKNRIFHHNKYRLSWWFIVLSMLKQSRILNQWEDPCRWAGVVMQMRVRNLRTYLPLYRHTLWWHRLESDWRMHKNARFCSKELKERAVAPRNCILFEHRVNQSVH